jgi:hypothetical protein
MAFRADMDNDYELLDPRVIVAARARNMSVLQAKEAAAAINLSLQMLDIEEAPKGQIALQFFLRVPLISPKEEVGLSTYMQNVLS